VYGIEGAAIGSATALFLVGGLTLMELYYLDGIHPFTRDFGKIVFAGLPATIAGIPIVVLVPSDLAVVVALPIVVIGVYVATLVTTDSFTDQDAQLAEEFGPGVRRWLPVGRFGR